MDALILKVLKAVAGDRIIGTPEVTEHPGGLWSGRVFFLEPDDRITLLRVVSTTKSE